MLLLQSRHTSQGFQGQVWGARMHFSQLHDLRTRSETKGRKLVLIPTDVTQVRAFLGCVQQMAGYCKELQIISAPLHVLTKKTTQFPKPWLAGTNYDLAFHRVKALLLDESLYLHHKDPSKILYIEVDASDVGWGACAYQMRNPFEGDPKDEA